MTTSTPGRMPVIAFSDDADFDTLLSVLRYEWCVALVLKNGQQVEVSLAPTPQYWSSGYSNVIGGKTWMASAPDGRQDWNGPEFYVPLDDVVQIIVL